VWFTGVHSDIGGGYPQDGLSYVTFDWMLDRAKAYGLRYFDEQRELLIDPQINPSDKLNDSAKGWRATTVTSRAMFSIPTARRPTSRRSSATSANLAIDNQRLPAIARHDAQSDQQTEILADLHPSMRAPAGEETKVQPVPKATFHEAVFNRIKAGTDRYAPVVVPATYFFTGKTGAITDALHPVDPGVPRSHVQDDVWNWVWLRRVVYFLTVFATLFVAFIPFFVIYALTSATRRSVDSSFRSSMLRIISAWLPGTVVRRLSQCARVCARGVIAVAVLMIVGEHKPGRIAKGDEPRFQEARQK